MTDLAEWVAVDWGTSNLRAWVFGPENRLIAQLGSDEGTAELTPDAFEPVLIRLIGPHLGTRAIPVICSGMVGAPQGWQDARYVTIPCAPPGGVWAVNVNAHDPRIAALILPGLQQSAPADVMNGEETKIAGFIAENPDFDGVLCLLGAHTKWVNISAREVVSFRTFMTGELFALLSEQSVLHPSVQAQDWDAAAFIEAVNDTLGAPQNLTSRLSGVQAQTQVDGMTATTAKSKLLGLLVGCELAGARPYWLGQRIALIGDTERAALYKAALDQQGAPVEFADADAMTLAGLKAAYAGWKDNRK